MILRPPSSTLTYPLFPYTPLFRSRIPEMNLYVPTPCNLIRNHIRQGSAVVGLPRNDGHIHCYYEGGVSSETIFADRLSSACGRLSEKAPTTAFAFVKEDDLQLVGTVKWEDRKSTRLNSSH